MKLKPLIHTLSCAAVAIVWLESVVAAAEAGVAKNVIIMVPDGMGLADVTAARIFKGGEDGPPLAFESLPQIGYQRTHSADSTVTDSAAAASAWATGRKHDNGQISWCGENDRPVTILELAKREKKSTGLVVTSTLTHATPAAFAAHVASRRSQGEIARQYIEETRVDVLLGGGFGSNAPPSELPVLDLDVLTAAATDYGYAVLSNKVELALVLGSDVGRVLGLFTPDAKTPEHFRVMPENDYPDGEPTLAEMTAVALELLARDPDGFFLVVEGSQIDWANHANNYQYQLAEVLGFEAAVGAVLNWINAEPGRRDSTLLIVVPDHETGGYAVNGPYGMHVKAGGFPMAAWTTSQHSGVDTLIWSQGPGSEELGRALDNVDLFGVMARAMGIAAPAETSIQRPTLNAQRPTSRLAVGR